MKKKRLTVIIIFAVLASLAVHAQKFELVDLKKFNEMTLAEFKTQMKEVYKYSYTDRTESERYTLFEYESPDFMRKVGKFDYKDATSNCIEYFTKDTEEFLKLKLDVQKMGFKLNKTEIKRDGTYNDYKKGNADIRLFIPKDTISKNEYYEVIIYK